MRNKLNFLIKNSFNRKVKSKWFIIANVVLAIVICCIINLDTIVKKFGGDFNEKEKIFVIDNVNGYETLKSGLKEQFKVKKTNKTKKELKKKLKQNEYIIVLDESDNYMDATVVSNSYLDTLEYQYIVSAINNTKVSIAMQKSNIKPEVLNKIYSNVEIKREYLDKEKKSVDEMTTIIMTTVFPVVILPFFMLSIFLIQSIGSEINDEKTTKGMEIIISNVSYRVHFASKVIANNLFILMQGALILLYGIVGLIIRSFVTTSSITSQISGILKDFNLTNILNQFGYIIPITLILMILTLIGYSILAGILASMTTNQEDFNHLQSPLVIVLLIGYYLSIMAGVFKGSILIRILSYFPFISAILSPSLLIINQITIFDVIGSIIVMILTLLIMVKYGLRIYKEGILNYTSKDLWKKIFKALKN